MIGPCRVIEMLDVKESIGSSELEKFDLDGVVRVLFKTKNSKLWESGKPEFQKNFIQINEESAKFLIEYGVKLVGIDYLSVERFGSPDHATYHLLLRNQVVIIVGLN